MKKVILPSFLGNRLNFELPKSWAELKQDQLHYVFFLMASFPQVTAQTYLFFRLLGISVRRRCPDGWLCLIRFHRKKIRFYIQDWEVMFFQKHLNWLYSPNEEPVRLDKVGHCQAVHPKLHGFSFEDYLQCENCYQGYLMSKDMEALQMMGTMLYPDKRSSFMQRIRPQRFKDFELFSIFLWWASVKQLFAKQFPHFFQRISSSAPEDEEMPNMLEQMNTQIRALSGGDITKEMKVLEMDCWRALTELNEKAREYKELQKKQKK